MLLGMLKIVDILLRLGTVAEAGGVSCLRVHDTYNSNCTRNSSSFFSLGFFLELARKKSDILLL